jgi:glycosyltransferase involved in cell wall biosynthesis
MNSTHPLITVIIPCYNSGEFIEEAVFSVKSSEGVNIEIVIVDDGSTDSSTLSVLMKLKQHGYRVVVQQNRGPAAARNSGEKIANGDYLFFLDSDNKICPDYLRKALKKMQSDKGIGVVYADAIFFGLTDKPRFKPAPFSFDQLLIGNYIDMCAMVRREAFVAVGGFDEARELIGYEDWELWIRLGLTNWKFSYLNEKLFYYRIRADSLMSESDLIKKESAIKYVMGKHSIFLHKHFKYYFRLYLRFQEKPFIYFLKVIFSKYFLRSRYQPNPNLK